MCMEVKPFLNIMEKGIIPQELGWECVSVVIKPFFKHTCTRTISYKTAMYDATYVMLCVTAILFSDMM